MVSYYPIRSNCIYDVALSQNSFCNDFVGYHGKGLSEKTFCSLNLVFTLLTT